MKEKAIYFPGLNGLRAIAALTVVISHTTLALGKFGLNPYLFGHSSDNNPIGIYLGNYGVSMFFTLSGFLITYLLEAEKDLHPIDIKKFYLRRILRIWPLYYVYLAIAVITIFAFNLHFNFISFILYFFYCANVPHIIGTDLPFLNHYWSLGVEEQFYLFWPWVIKKVKGNIVLLVTVLTGALIAAKLALYFRDPASVSANVLMVTRFHCMLMGCLAAILYKRKNALLIKIGQNKLTQIVCWTIILLSAVNKFHIGSIIDNEIISGITVFLIIGQIGERNRIINLENKVCDFLGKISYGIYVIHPLLIFYFSKILYSIPGDSVYKYALIYLVVVGGTIFIAYLSYEYFEKYFLRLKRKYTVVKSENAKPG